MDDAVDTLPALEITSRMGDILGNALNILKPVAVAYMGADGKPKVSYRGSVMRLNDRQLAMWLRSPKSGVIAALDNNPSLSLMYSDWTEGAHVYFNMAGRGQVSNDPVLREKIYEALPQIEKDHDKERNGVPVVIELESLMSLMDGKVTQLGAAAGD